MRANINEIELVVNDENEDFLSAMGFVDMPAIEQNLVYFNKGKQNYTFGKIDEEKGIIVSPALIPEKRIFRFNPETNEEYYVYFTEETIRTLSQNFLKQGMSKNVTEQHETPVDGIYLIYSWIVENQEDPLITKYGFKNIPNGTWAVSYKIENEDIKEKIKNKEIGGLSIEAYLSEKFSKIDLDKQKIEEIKSLLNSIK